MQACATIWRRASQRFQSLVAIIAERTQRWNGGQSRRLLKSGLPNALTNGQLYVVYQPKFALREGRYDGVETLLRWQHPKFGDVDRGSIVQIAEASGQIDALTLWILDQAVKDQHLLSRKYGALCFYVNISAKSLGNNEFIRLVCASVKAASGTIGFEITETAFIVNPLAAIANLDRLVAAGIKVSIDDYGSGHSSLAYLKHLPADEIKIDKLFVSGMTSSNRDPLIVRSTIDLAHALGMQVVAEGVESQATLALLRAMGCDLAQGFFISPALRLAELECFLGDNDHLRRLRDTQITLTPSRAFWKRSERAGDGDTINGAQIDD